MRKIFPMIFILLCGCIAPYSGTVGSHCETAKKAMQNISVMPARETSAPDAAEKAYGQFLRENANFKKINVYGKQLETELEQLQKTDTGVLSKESVFAFPYYYRMQLDAIVDAHLGLARIARARGNMNKAATEALTARGWVTDYCIWQHHRAQLMIKVSEMLVDIYTSAGETGKALNAKLDRDLFADYMASKQGIKDRFAERQDFLAAYDKRIELDKLVNEINKAREKKNDQQGFAFLQNAMQLTAAYSQMSAASSYSGNAAASQQFAAQMQVLNMVNSITASGDSSSVQSAAPVNFTLAGQFINPDAGVKTRDIVRLFATTAATLSGKDEIQKNAETVINLMDGISEVRQGLDSRNRIEQVGHFIKALDALKSEMDTLGATQQ